MAVTLNFPSKCKSAAVYLYQRSTFQFSLRYTTQRQGPERQSHQEVEVSVISISAGIYFLLGWPVCHLTSHHFNPGLFPCQLARLSVALTLPATSREADGTYQAGITHNTLHFTSHTHTHTHRFMCSNFHMKMDECTEIQKQTDRHAYSHKHTLF